MSWVQISSEAANFLTVSCMLCCVVLLCLSVCAVTVFASPFNSIPLSEISHMVIEPVYLMKTDKSKHALSIIFSLKYLSD